MDKDYMKKQGSNQWENRSDLFPPNGAIKSETDVRDFADYV